MNYETHLYPNCKGEIQQFDTLLLLRKLSTTQLLGIMAPPLLNVIAVLQGHPIQRVAKCLPLCWLLTIVREVISGHR